MHKMSVKVEVMICINKEYFVLVQIWTYTIDLVMASGVRPQQVLFFCQR